MAGMNLRRSEGSTAPPRSSLYAQVRFARVWLPALIVGVVLVHQLVVVPLGDAAFRFWAQLLFYAILGPIVTFAVLDWIAGALQERERAETELQKLYGELRDSYAVLGALQRITERFAAAPDLETAVGAAVGGVREATGAAASAVVLGQKVLGLAHEPHRDGDRLRAYALAFDEALARPTTAGTPAWTGPGQAIGLPLAWGGRHEGTLFAWFERPLDEQRREMLAIVAADFAAAAEAVQGRTRDLLTLFEVDRSIRAEGNLARLLDTLLTQMMSRVDAGGAGVYLLDEDGSLALRAAVGADGRAALADPSAPVRAGEGIVGRVVVDAESVILPALDDAERAGAGALLEHAGSATLLPLMAGEPIGRVQGVVVLTHTEPGHFDAGHLPFLALLASQVSLAVRNADAYLQSEELAIAEERARIAREIHDGVAQSLAFAALKLDLVVRLLRRDPDEAERELGQAKTTIREMIREVRRSIFALRPVDLERYGLVETLRRYALDFGQQNDVGVELDVESLAGLSMKTEAVLFRIFQEAMNNVAKHAKASSVHVALGPCGDDAVELVVEDDGVGFDPTQVADRVTTAGGLGLRQMEERVTARGGRFSAVSLPGKGTQVRVRVPV
jgi:signal transduction histidine kinase